MLAVFEGSDSQQLPRECVQQGGRQLRLDKTATVTDTSRPRYTSKHWRRWDTRSDH